MAAAGGVESPTVRDESPEELHEKVGNAALLLAPARQRYGYGLCSRHGQ